MAVLSVLSEIWKNGAILELKENGQINILNHENIPKGVMAQAENEIEGILKWLESWKNATPIELTMLEILKVYCGWSNNAAILEWLNGTNGMAEKFYDWTMILTHNGWRDLYADHRQYENEKSNELARVIYKNACEYTTKG